MILMKNWTWHPAWQSDTEWHMTALAKETQESEDEDEEDEDDDAPDEQDEPPPPSVNMSRLSTDQRRLSLSYLERLNCKVCLDQCWNHTSSSRACLSSPDWQVLSPFLAFQFHHTVQILSLFGWPSHTNEHRVPIGPFFFLCSDNSYPFDFVPQAASFCERWSLWFLVPLTVSSSHCQNHKRFHQLKTQSIFFFKEKFCCWHLCIGAMHAWAQHILHCGTLSIEGSWNQKKPFDPPQHAKTEDSKSKSGNHIALRILSFDGV